MRELSLFTGAGGGLLGTHLLGWRPVGYVEFNEYCQQVIAQRIADRLLPIAPIFGDVRKFVQSGAAAQYRGIADVVTAGFPCQPFSSNGKRLGEDDERNMWPATLGVIRAARPRFCLLENVRGLLSSGYFGTILQDLAESGYDARWRLLSAAELGAPHRRERVWVAAWDAQAADTPKAGCPQVPRAEPGEAQQPIAGSAPQAGDDGGQRPQGDWWAAEPGVGRMVYGLAHRVDRVAALGNGQVPIVAATAWKLLMEDFDE